MSRADLVNLDTGLARVQIRQLRAADLPALEWEGAYTHFRRVYARAYQRALRGLSVLWVAEGEGGRLLGRVFVLLRSETDPAAADGKHRAFIYSFRVRSEVQNRGLGTRLIHIAETDLATRGFAIASLNVGADNLGALRLYERLGYQRQHPVSGYWTYEDHLGIQREVHEPGWRMCKSITNNK